MWKVRNTEHNKSFVGKWFKSYEDDGNNHWVYIHVTELDFQGNLIGQYVKVYGDMGKRTFFHFSNSSCPISLDENYANDGYMTEISEQEYLDVIKDTIESI